MITTDTQAAATVEYLKAPRQFHLNNGTISYLMKVDKHGKLLNLYFGSAVPRETNYAHLVEMLHRSTSVNTELGDDRYSLEHLRQELPEHGSGDFRDPAIQIKQANGSEITNFTYQTHKIYAGKKPLPGLPASYVENDDEATTLELTLTDDLTKIDVLLSYTIFRDFDAIARSLEVVNRGEEAAVIERIMSLNLDLPDADYEWLQLSGAWSRERNVKTRHLQQGTQSISSARGASSQTQNPFVALIKDGSNEFTGETIGATFVYSGNFLASAEVDTWDVTRLQLGINPQGFSWHLAPETHFQAPEALVVFSEQGLNGMSQTFHKLLRTRVAQGYWRDRERPILLNNWEATQYDFDENKLVSIASKAKEVGVELFVLDDGWFGERNSDTAGLGDWYANKERLPKGIKSLSERIEGMGMKFGLWFEPEMVNKDSELYRAHPDWIIHTPDRNQSNGRNQFVLNLAREEVVDHIFDAMDNILSNASISYIKWDMNRSMTEVFDISRSEHHQGEVFHRYILGVYELYRRINQKFPELLIESCSAGGGRFDAGLLQYAPQAWASDCSDAVERYKIQYGTSMVYPLSAIGAHVSAVPNHQVNRVTPLDTRFNVAFFGAFGYELDLNELSESEIEQVKKQIQLVKDYRGMIQQGDFYRLKSPFEGNITSWMVVTPEKETALVGYYKTLNDVNGPYRRLYLKGLDEEKIYRLKSSDKTYSGKELMKVGFVASDASSGEYCPSNPYGTSHDFDSKLWIFEVV